MPHPKETVVEWTRNEISHSKQQGSIPCIVCGKITAYVLSKNCFEEFRVCVSCMTESRWQVYMKHDIIEILKKAFPHVPKDIWTLLSMKYLAWS